jgi:two-component system sensor histidine kinase PilS (NtrC family)
VSQDGHAGPDRRTAARRRRARDESWFGALGVNTDSQQFADEPDSRYDGWKADAEPDSRFLFRQARRLIGAEEGAFHRIYAAFLAARAALGLALALSIIATTAFASAPAVAVVTLSLVYASLSISTWLLPRLRSQRRLAEEHTRLRMRQYAATIGVDIVCFAALHGLSDSANLNYVALLVLPVLMAGVLTPRIVALATAAVVTLVLLVVAWLGVAAGGASGLVTQAGLTGAGLFVITLLAGELAGRLAREDEMQEGVLVVDRRGRVRTANPAARALLGPDGATREASFLLSEVDAWSALVKAVERAFAEGLWPEAGRDVTLHFDDGTACTLRLRVRFTRRRGPDASEDLCVLFVEDVRSLQARIRQEKLAAMGRVSAGIAHEIRNPLAAISQANALMAEDATTASQRQLTRMVSDNVERLKRIVDDVMEVAPADVPEPPAIDLCAHVAGVCSEWARTAQLPLDERSPLRVDLPEEPIGALFDADHLRRVLVNLLDNGHRHSTQQPGAMRVSVNTRDELVVVLSVRSDGEPIPPDVERYLFEPFFSTRSRGTGLGLYICRELCERYRARIDYRLRAASESNRNEFFVAMRRAPLHAADTGEARLHLSS